MKDYDKSVKINHSPKQPYIPDHPFKILIIGGLWSGENNVLLNLIKHQRPDIDKILFTCQISTWIKYQLLINRREKVGITKLENSKAFLDYSQTINDVYENLQGYNPTKKRRVLYCLMIW